jgi:hypothetical protein
LDRAQLLAQVVLALTARQLFLRLRLDLGLHRADFELAAQERIDAAQPREAIDRLEHFLRFGEPQPEVRSDQVREPARLVDVRGDRKNLRRQVLERQQFLDAPAHGARQRFRLGVPLALFFIRQHGDLRPLRRLVLHERIDARLGDALHQRLHAPVRQAQDAHHHRDGADAVKIVCARVFEFGVALGDEQ